MRFIQRACFCCFVACVTLLLSHQGVACGDTHEYGPNLHNPGCEQLNVTIHNSTHYTFVPEQAQFISGGFVALSSFPDIPPDINGVATTFSLKGSTVANTALKDDIEANVNYVATINGDKKGTQFTLSLKKASCNAIDARYTETDDHCYDYWPDTTPHCTWNAFYGCHVCTVCDPIHCETSCNPYGGCSSICTGGGNCHTATCESAYRYKGIKCYDAVNDTSNAAVTSNVNNLFPGLYITPVVNTSKFVCQKSTIHDASDDENKPGTTEFTIKPVPIEALIIKLPFDPKTPTAKLLEGSIYNNLNAEYLGRLGSYFSYQPVVMRDQEIAFSTLCNSASCPGA